MALESFYGGKQGISPVIKARFKYESAEDPAYQAHLKPGYQTKLTKEEATWLNDALNVNTYVAGNFVTWTPELLKPFTMNECFKDPNYKDVWYGELCIIDTDNKLNPNNGNLYRRTLRQATLNNKYLYAEYIGQIVGPSGGIPNFDFGSLDAERGKAVGTVATYSTEQAPLDNSSWEYSYPKEENNNITITTEVPDNKDSIAVLSAAQPGGNEANIQMVPGKQGDTYNDTIRYTWCNVRRKLDGKDDDVWVYLGFEIPYTIYDVQGHEENYTYNGDIFINNSDSNHPFYKQYDFHIPRGTRGIGPERIFTINPKDLGAESFPVGETLYDFDAIDYDQATDIYSINTSKTKTINTDSSYWVGKWNLYNPKTTTVDTIYQYLGSYKDVRGVSLAHDGTLTFTYSDNSTQDVDEKIKWITSITIDTTQSSNTYGTMTINYNNGEPFTKVLPFIKSIGFNDSTGKITATYANANTSIVIKDSLSGNDFVFAYPKTITLDTDSSSGTYGKLEITSNINTLMLQETLPLIKDVDFNSSTGKITFTYSKIGDKVIGDISYISKMKILDNGTLQYQMNTETNTWHDLTKIKDIDNIRILDTGHLQITYRDGSNSDLGLVRGNAIAGVVYTLESERSDKSFESENLALQNLQQKTYNTSASTTIGGNNDGRIKVNNSDVTGGLVIATIKEQENSEEFYSVLFYYNNNLHVWQSAGIVGNIGSGGGQGNSNIYIQTRTTAYPEEDAINPQIYFVDGTANNASALDKTFAMEDFVPWVFNE